MTKVLALAVLLTSTSLSFAGTTTFTGIACAMRSDADVIVTALAQAPALTFDADIASDGARLVADTDACVSLEATSDQVDNATFVSAKGGERIGLTQIGGQHFVFVDIPMNF